MVVEGGLVAMDSEAADTSEVGTTVVQLLTGLVENVVV